MSTSGQHAAVLEGVRRIFGGGTVAGLGADSLLRRFASRRDEAAFEAIVARHGPMVLGVCRRVLDDRHDVEDAFQATFLVFVKKAGSIRDGEGLGPWLHGVARRVATRSRMKASRRRATERSGVEVDPASPSVDPDRDEIRAVVDEEIGRLPDHYRKAVVLCDLEGVTQFEAARRLDWTEGTVRGRLAKARGLLRSRLARRGLVAPSAVFAGLFVPDVASAARLGERLVRAALKAMTKGAAIGVGEVSTSAVTLAKEVIQVMIRQKIGTTAVALAVAGVVLSGTGVAVVRGQRASDPRAGKAEDAINVMAKAKARRPPDPLPKLPLLDAPPEPDKPPDTPDPEPADTRRIAIGDRLIIELLEALPGRDIRGERLVRPDGTVSLGFYGDLKIAGLTRREAKVEVVEHMRDFLADQTLGLMTYDESKQEYVRVHPALSSRVYVDDSPTFETNRANALASKPNSPGTVPRFSTQPNTKKGADDLVRGQSKSIAKDPFSAQPPSQDGLVIGRDKPAANDPFAVQTAKKPAIPADLPRHQGRQSPADPANKPATIQPGDHLLIEILEALPGRPIAGERLVRPDGTVGLGYYGDVKLAGLTRVEAKTRVIEHFRQYLADEALGLVETKEDGKVTKIAPERSTHAFVDVVDEPPARGTGEARMDALEQKLDRILGELDALKRGR